LCIPPKVFHPHTRVGSVLASETPENNKQNANMTPTAGVHSSIMEPETSLPFRGEPGGGRRMKPRQTTTVIKPVTKPGDPLSSPTRRQTLRVIEAKAPSLAVTGREAKDPKAAASSSGSSSDTKGASASGEWEQSEHEGLLTMMDGRKRWFHCTK
jgi:hypothetical protein